MDPDCITVVWPNEADFSPNILYEIGVDVEEQKKALVKIRKPAIKPPVRAFFKEASKKS